MGEVVTLHVLLLVAHAERGVLCVRVCVCVCACVCVCVHVLYIFVRV